MKILENLKCDFTDIKFVAANKFKWAPEDKTIYYSHDKENGDWSLLHEAGHMLCGHKSYSNDLGLLRMEVEAWEKAKELASKYSYSINEEHIQQCLDTYRDWIYKRSTCPTCSQAGVEKSTGQYTCINCSHQWQVSSERFCRTYRKTVTA